MKLLLLQQVDVYGIHLHFNAVSLLVLMQWIY